MSINGHEALDIRFAKLAAAAAALNEAGGERAARAPAALAYLTDQARHADPLEIVNVLPPGAMVVFRDYRSPDRTIDARAIATLCRDRNLKLFVGDDEALAREIGAVGLHLPERAAREISHKPADLLLSVACHTAAALERAQELNADCAFLSPVFATASHPGAASLGAEQFKKLAANASCPILALGGVNSSNAHYLAGEGVAGFGAIGAFHNSGE